jgi:DNA-binding CsgD family transcriptional regulator
LVGRAALEVKLHNAIAEAQKARGQLLLLAGEAGVGKTRLAQETLETANLRILTTPTVARDPAPYAPIVGLLRAYRRQTNESSPFADVSLGRYLNALLPELGAAPPNADRSTLVEALRAAFEHIACRKPTAIFIDDLHEADHATFALLPHLAAAAESVPLLLLAAYRADEIGRDHPLRSLRNALRRAGKLHELHVEPLDAADSALLAEQLLGHALAPALAAWLYTRTLGLPLFIEELVALLASSHALRPRNGQLELAQPAVDLPVPETVRDLVLLRTARLSDSARAALEVAAVVGVAFDLDLVARLSGGEQTLEEAFASGLLVETGQFCGAFRHPLMRDAVYGDIAWPRRRGLHRAVAQQLDRGACGALVLAEHWLAGRDLERARNTLLEAALAAADVHAYRDAAACARRALELWPEGHADAERLTVLGRLGDWAELSGNLGEALSAWRQVAEAQADAADWSAVATVQRRIAAVFELQGVWDAALSAREAAASAFARSGASGEAAAERLAAAAHLRSAGTFAPALELLGLATDEAVRAGRRDLQARILGLVGNLRARQGDYTPGLELVRSGLALALEHNLATAAAEVYQRLGDSYEQAGELTAARQTYLAAAEFCQVQGAAAAAQLCLACMTVVLRQNGDWSECERVCREVQASSEATLHARAVSAGMLGLLWALRGDPRRAQPLLLDAARIAQHIELVPMDLLSAWGLAMVDDLEGRAERAAQRCWALLERWGRSDERHFVVPALRWAASLFGSQSDAAGARACAHALAQIVARVADLEAVAALGHALGEVSLCEGDLARAAEHFEQAVERLGGLDLPYDRAHSALRSGTVLLSQARTEAASARLREAHRMALTLGATPLALAAARQLAASGEDLAAGVLSRREHEVTLLLAEGCTNREIAERLVISERTAENHVQRILNRLGLRSRTQVAAWAVQHGIAPARA